LVKKINIMKTTKWYVYLSFLLMIIFFMYHFKSPNKIRSTKFKDDISKEFNSIVINKYIDKENHGYNTCLFKNKDNTIKFIFGFDRSGLFEYIEIGDSIIKPSGDSLVIVKRNEIVKEFMLDYGIE